MRLKSMKIGTKLTLAAGALVTVSLAAVTGIGSWVMMQSARDAAKLQILGMAGEHANAVAEAIGAEVSYTVTLAEAAGNLIAAGMVDSDAIGRMVNGLVSTNPDIVGSTLAFEPGALDGRDADFVGHPYSDAGGRFVPYFYWSKGQVAVERLVMTEEAGIESWYSKPLRENRAQATPAYTYPVDGTDVLMTSVAVPVRKDGKAIGIATADLALTDLSARIAEVKPFGAGHAHLVGAGLWLANPDPARLGKPVDDPDVARLIAAVGPDGVATEVAEEETGEPVLRLVRRIQFAGLDEPWYLSLEVPEAATIAGAIDTRNKMVAASAVFLLLIAGLTAWGSRSLARPIVDMTATMRRLAGGDTSVEIGYRDRAVEIGSMAAAVETFRADAIERSRLEQAQGRDAAERERRQRAVEALIAAFRTSASSGLQSVSAIAGRMETSAEQLTAVADETSKMANGAAASSQQASANVQTVASATEELSASVSEIAEKVARTATVVNDATAAAHATNGKVAALADAASRIGAVIDLIRAIAEQTNLLALNATIEAARAGDAGRGFAVVASEVKSLAAQTAKATDEIAAQIGGIQDSTGSAVSAIAAISGQMEQVNAYTSAIAASVEEQGAAAAEISRNVLQASAGTGDVAHTAVEVNAAAVRTTRSAGEVLQASRDVAGQAENLRRMVARFLDEVAAA